MEEDSKKKEKEKKTGSVHPFKIQGPKIVLYCVKTAPILHQNVESAVGEERRAFWTSRRQDGPRQEKLKRPPPGLAFQSSCSGRGRVHLFESVSSLCLYAVLEAQRSRVFCWTSQVIAQRCVCYTLTPLIRIMEQIESLHPKSPLDKSGI